MYRAITWAGLQHGIDPEDEAALSSLAETAKMEVVESSPGRLDGVAVDGLDATPHLRSAQVEAAVSLVSQVPGVRHAMVRRQRALAQDGRIVMAGRDIGTAVLPNADLKVYLDAPLEERVRRRLRELRAAGSPAHEAQVAKDIRRRDRIDSAREMSPMRPAADAVVIDTDALPLEQVVERVLELVQTCASSGS